MLALEDSNESQQMIRDELNDDDGFEILDIVSGLRELNHLSFKTSFI